MPKLSKRKRLETSQTPPLDHKPQPARFSWSAATYVHHPLPTTTSIRILELQPGEGTNIIKCQLSVFERDQAPRYEAISYSWGRATDTRVISCENKKLKVTANLRDALWRIRDPVEVKFLWADAVCINQEDNEERATQVKHMALIYANAVRVLVWLDLPNSKFEDFEDLFDFDFDNSRVSEQGEQANKVLDQHVVKLESRHARGSLDHDTDVISNAFSNLFDSPWFSRLWVVQEVGMAKSVLTLIGDATISFSDLIRFILRLERRTLLMDQLGLFTAGKANIFTTFPARSRELRGEVDDDWDFLELLEVTRAQKASDARDYVYALLGHPSAIIDGGPVVVPDYNRSADSLFFEVVMKMISQTGSLRVLSAVHHSDEIKLKGKSPSWIPTWSRDAYILSLGVYRDHYYDVTYDACAGRLASWELIASRKALRVQGFVFDAVDEHTSTVELNDSGQMAPKGLGKLIPIAVQFKTRAAFTPYDNVLSAGKTLTAGFRNDNSPQFDADFAAFRLHLLQEASNQGGSARQHLSPEGMVALQQAAQRGNVDEIYWAASRFCTGRKLFSTRQGLLGLGPAVIREGDLCCIIFGTPVPFILRPVRAQYKLVGEAYVQGVMKGEAMVDLILGEKYKEQTFELS